MTSGGSEAGSDGAMPLVAGAAAAAENAGRASSAVREVWAWNLDQEFSALVAAADHGNAGTGCIVALDMEFPGFLRQQPRSDAPGAKAAKYQALRENVDHLRPIQLGVAVAGPDGVLRGVWSFNLSFNLNVDLHTEKSVAFLRAAGFDFQRLADEGIEASALGLRLARSRLVKSLHSSKLPQWVTFSGTYDLGYLIKLLTANRPLPYSSIAYDAALEAFCPHRHELRDNLPHGSLDAVAKQHGVVRRGVAHTAGSDALLTLELFLLIVGVPNGSAGRHLVKWNATRGMGEAWSAATVDHSAAHSLSGGGSDAVWSNSWHDDVAQSMTGWEKSWEKTWDKMSGWEKPPRWENKMGWQNKMEWDGDEDWDASLEDYSWSWAWPQPMAMPWMFWFPPTHKVA